MAFSYPVRSSLPRARALLDSRKSFRLNPSLLLASSGSHHNNNHHLSSSTPNLSSPCPTLIRLFSDRTPNERESEPLNTETTFGTGKGKKSGSDWLGYPKYQSNEGWLYDETPWYKVFLDGAPLIICLVVTSIYIVILIKLSGFAFERGVEEKNKEMFEEFKLRVLEPELVRWIVVDHSIALVYVKNNTKFQSVPDRDKPIEKDVYLLDINSPKSFKVELEQTQKNLRLKPVPVIDVTKDYPRKSGISSLRF